MVTTGVRIPSGGNTRALLLFGLSIATALLFQSARAAQVDASFVGPGTDYNDAANWSPAVVPNNGNGGNTYRVTIGNPVYASSVASSTDVAIDSLTLQDSSSLRVSNHSFTSAATRNEAAVVLSPYSSYEFFGGITVAGSMVDTKSASANLGTLANYNPATETLESGGYNVYSYDANYQARLAFNGARIVTNNAIISIAGGGARITDEFGADALAPLAVNNGLLFIAQSFATAGDFTNNGDLRLNAAISPSAPSVVFNVTGRLTNFNPATKTLSGGTFFVASPNNTGTTVSLQFTGADVVTNSATLKVTRQFGAPNVFDEHGRDALRNLANNTASGNLTLDGDFATNAAQFSNAGYLRLNSVFTLPSGSTFVQSDGTLVVNQNGTYSTGRGKLDTDGGKIMINGGMLIEAGRLIGQTTNNGLISPGDGVSRYTPLMVFEGSLGLGSSSVLRFDLAGFARGPGAYYGGPFGGPPPYGYDAIDCSGNVSLGGELQVVLSSMTQSGARFTPGAGDTFVVVKAQAPIAGSFSNVANGQRINTVDGGGSFVVNYGLSSAFDPTGVVLSAFQPNSGPAVLRNISTRGLVTGGQRVVIGGFIVTGSEPKPVIVRALGPSLRSAGVTDVLDDPVLTLYDNSGTVLVSNDDWQKSNQRTAIQASGIPPNDAREAAVIATLAAGSYTAVIEGKNGDTGLGLVEVYDLNTGTQSQLANISTRGFAEHGDYRLIGGIIVGGGGGSTDVLVRALGPSLAKAGVTDPIEDPGVVVYNAYGSAFMNNGDWQFSQRRAEIEQIGMAPTDPREAADIGTLPPGSYTALVGPSPEDKGGVALVEFYRLK